MQNAAAKSFAAGHFELILEEDDVSRVLHFHSQKGPRWYPPSVLVLRSPSTELDAAVALIGVVIVRTQ